MKTFFIRGRTMPDELTDLLSNLKEKEALAFVEKSLEAGANATDLLDQAREGMNIVGQRFADQIYFIPDLVYSGEILKEVVQLLEPHLKEDAGEEKEAVGKIVIGTVAGDIHDIGKDLVSFMLDVSGYKVTDLGIDVPVQKFVEAIQETECQVVALSGFLTLAYDSMKETVEAIKAAGLRNKVKIMIGGGQIDEQVREYTGADAYGLDAVSAVHLANGWIGG
jgi:5-methyltetrahydrofolate--homocysteine methyltransferase